jgi:hypothetical protein
MSSCSVGLKTQRLQFQSQNIGTKARHTTIHNPAEPAAHYNFWPMIPPPDRVAGRVAPPSSHTTGRTGPYPAVPGSPCGRRKQRLKTAELTEVNGTEAINQSGACTFFWRSQS